MSDARSPARSAPTSALGRHDLLRRVERLRLGDEAPPRVLRLIEAEVEAAVERALDQRYTVEEIQAAGGGDELVVALRAQRADRDRATAIAKAGLHELEPEQLASLLSAARAGRS
ncbi:MAG: hypothetical protein JKY65_09670 [Planctomycetes bacterium]|nr:hypothetical protein [Planctomycetota bacterium]